MALSCTLLFAILSTDCAQKTLWSIYVLNDALGGNDWCKLVFPSTSLLCFRMSKPAVMLQLLLNGYISVVYASFTMYESEKLLEFSIIRRKTIWRKYASIVLIVAKGGTATSRLTKTLNYCLQLNVLDCYFSSNPVHKPLCRCFLSVLFSVKYD